MRKPSQTPQIETAFLQLSYKKCNTTKALCDPGSLGLSLFVLCRDVLLARLVKTSHHIAEVGISEAAVQTGTASSLRDAGAF